MRLIWIRQCNADKYYVVWKGRFPKELRHHPKKRKPSPKQSCLHPKQICVSSSPPSTWLLTPSKISTLLGSVRQGCHVVALTMKSHVQRKRALKLSVEKVFHILLIGLILKYLSIMGTFCTFCHLYWKIDDQLSTSLHIKFIVILCIPTHIISECELEKYFGNFGQFLCFSWRK